MLQINKLSITHKKDLSPLVRELSFILSPGDRAAIIGEEGNGKSSILKLLYDPALIEPYAEWSGGITGYAPRRGYLAQELTPIELAQPVWKFCQNALETVEPGDSARTAVQMGLDSSLFYDCRPLSTLSGGERVKLRLTLLLLGQPDILLLDEPSNDLDIETLEWLERFLLSCDVPVIYVSHDESLLNRTANLIIHLERLNRRTQPRNTVARMGYHEYVEKRSAAFMRQAQAAKKEKDEFDSKMERYRQIRSRVEHEQASISRQNPHGGRLLKKKMHAVQSMGRRFERERGGMTQTPQYEQAILTAFDDKGSMLPSGKGVLELELPALYAEDHLLAKNIHLRVIGPEKVGITGLNGSGKTTLLRLAADTLMSRRDLRAAYMPQNYDECLLGEKSPVELLAPSERRDEITQARTLLGAMKFKTEEMDHKASELSGGQRAKLLFLRMVLQKSNVLLLDEPTRNFSPQSAPVIRDALARFPGCIISVSHDRLYLKQVCSRVLRLTPDGLFEEKCNNIE